MIPVFADTFFFLALLNERDAAHGKALAANRVNRRLLTSAWVLMELADFLCGEQNRRLFGEIIDELLADARFEIVPAGQSAFDAATSLYRQRIDKSWSLTDCTSFVIMQQRGITESLTGDHHFEQAGFIALLV